ncbi:peptidase inhibitor family I36 protein [Amycolatopsis jejuensis]|uniref:peptidase inhibitor family I36 protein n=1 Tax=Amycolatopsis jejuensis TaxID=330084 RepID=UPI00138E3CD7|nr:peptidase inhibitor family I36 protein [Amycolatopsis jejuensis]
MFAVLLAASGVVAGGTAHAADRDAGAGVQHAIISSGRESGVIADAAGGWDRCPAGYFCLFDLHDGGGIMAYFRTGSPNLGMQGLDKMASAQWNRSTATFGTYEGYNYTGRPQFHPAGSRYNFTYWGGDNFDSSTLRR